MRPYVADVLQAIAITGSATNVHIQLLQHATGATVQALLSGSVDDGDDDSGGGG
eukprot:CAMPEP_0203811452 /NCGR_PEP_ID=MMETSP0115-20131106/3569_1 /ASSEMBLY_ACC=CAM_ASM_000227 /TAXON_ID=33651 /ORGANISM="Bicosoecid sp, Strain ms1" /LENGTH=53 /DNA_ID=CAMNT_0050720277 /DNA_START=242 /DNA_END=399 /DNA_ORIENTATION=+